MDVWVTNFRGSLYSRENLNFTRKQAEYWDFDVSDYAMKDYPAQIEYIYN